MENNEKIELKKLALQEKKLALEKQKIDNRFWLFFWLLVSGSILSLAALSFLIELYLK